MGIPASLLRQWLAEHSEFAAAAAFGRQIADAKVAQGLFDRAVGCEVETTEIMVEGEKRRMKKIRRQIPPDTRAAISGAISHRRQNPMRRSSASIR
jgi:hypothetical protein